MTQDTNEALRRSSVATTEELLERVGGNRDLLRDVVGLFVEDCPRMIGRIRLALEDRDSSALNRAAHTFKGSAANFGAEEVIRLAQQLETDALGGDFTTLADTLCALEAGAGQMLADLAASDEALR
jgi:HPt (histidine-containing phosphotransfer) domain-containing protein